MVAEASYLNQQRDIHADMYMLLGRRNVGQTTPLVPMMVVPIPDIRDLTNYHP